MLSFPLTWAVLVETVPTPIYVRSIPCVWEEMDEFEDTQ